MIYDNLGESNGVLTQVDALGSPLPGAPKWPPAPKGWRHFEVEYIRVESRAHLVDFTGEHGLAKYPPVTTLHLALVTGTCTYRARCFLLGGKWSEPEVYESGYEL